MIEFLPDEKKISYHRFIHKEWEAIDFDNFSAFFEKYFQDSKYKLKIKNENLAIIYEFTDEEGFLVQGKSIFHAESIPVPAAVENITIYLQETHL